MPSSAVKHPPHSSMESANLVPCRSAIAAYVGQRLSGQRNDNTILKPWWKSWRQ